MIKAKEDKKI